MTPRDEMAFVGDPSMIRPDVDEVHISCCFTWDKGEAMRLKEAWEQYYPIVKIGGPVFDDLDDPIHDGFIPGMYVRQGITFTSRGCNFQCPWCLVPKREGKLREFKEIQSGNVIQDNNLLQCSSQHIEKVFTMLKGQRAIEFTGGLDARLVTDIVAEGLRSLRVRQIFLACDTKQAIHALRKAIKRIGLPRGKVRCYVLLKFNPSETISEATERMIEIWGAGAMPFAQLYQPPDKWIRYPKEWRGFARIWSRPPIMKAFMRLNNVYSDKEEM